MKKILQWIEHHIIISIIIAFLAPLIIVHFLFKIQASAEFLAAEWSAGDLIGYIAGFEAFLGATFLGVIAYQQNETQNKEQKNDDAANTLTPYLCIDSVIYKDEEGKETEAPFQKSHYIVEGAKARIRIKNIGQGIATNVFYKDWFGELFDIEDHRLNINLNPDETYDIRIGGHNTKEDVVKSFEIEYQNIIGYKYKQELKYKLLYRLIENQDEEFDDKFYIYVYVLGKQQRLGLEAQ